jgi:hypothetical protein
MGTGGFITGFLRGWLELNHCWKDFILKMANFGLRKKKKYASLVGRVAPARCFSTNQRFEKSIRLARWGLNALETRFGWFVLR